MAYCLGTGTTLLTPWCRTLFEKLIVTQLVKNILLPLWNPKVHHRLHKGPTLDPILSQPNPVRPIDPYPPKFQLNVILPPTPRFSQWSLTFGPGTTSPFINVCELNDLGTSSFPSNLTPSHVNKGLLPESGRVRMECLDHLINNSQVGQREVGGGGSLQAFFLFCIKNKTLSLWESVDELKSGVETSNSTPRF
jgi:hypothetical protein